MICVTWTQTIMLLSCFIMPQRSLLLALWFFSRCAMAQLCAADDPHACHRSLGRGLVEQWGIWAHRQQHVNYWFIFFYFEIFSTWNEKCWKSLHWPVLQQGCGPCLRGAETQNQPCTFTTSALRHSLQQSKPALWIEQKSFSPQSSDYINPHSPGQRFLKNILGGQSFWPLQS